MIVAHDLPVPSCGRMPGGGLLTAVLDSVDYELADWVIRYYTFTVYLIKKGHKS